MALVEYELDGHVALMTWNSGENRFNPDFLRAHIDTLNEIQDNTDATVLVVRSSNEKIWCNGIDLEYLAPYFGSGDLKTVKDFFYLLNDYFKSILMCPLITVASINGHAFAGGAMAACAFDFRFMRSDRGFFCVPEIDLGFPFLPGMMALLKKAMPANLLHDCTLTGRRLTAGECMEAGMVKDARPLEELLDASMEFARAHCKKREGLIVIKREMYKDLVRTIDEEDPPFIEAGRFTV